MSLIFPGASSAFAEVDSTPVTAPPYTLACHLWTNAPAHEGPALGLFNKDSGGDWATVGVNAGKAELTCRSAAAGIKRLAAKNAFPSGSWQTIVGVFAADNSRRLYDGAAAPVYDSSNAAPLGLNRVAMGRYRDVTPSAALNATCAWFVIWNGTLGDQEAAFLAAGAHPYMVRPDRIVAAWDTISAAPERDLHSSLRMLTLNNLAADKIEPPVWDLPIQAIGRAKAIVTGNIALSAHASGETASAWQPALRGKAALIDWDIDPVAGILRVRVNRGPWMTKTFTAPLDPVQGDVFLGTRLADGVPAGTGNNLHLASLAAWSRRITDLERDTVNATMAKRLAPVVPAVKVNVSTTAPTQIKLLEQALDPSGEGLSIVQLGKAADVSLILDDANAGLATATVAAGKAGDKRTFTFLVVNRFVLPTTTVATCEMTLVATKPPVAKDDVATLKADKSIDIELTKNDTTYSNGLVVSLVTPPSNGTAEILAGAAKVRYTPTAGYVGDDSFTYTVTDDTGLTATGNVKITVESASTKPSKAYRVFGSPAYGGSQGDLGSDGGVYFRFTSANDGIFQTFLMLLQGARANCQYNDGHSAWNFGAYDLILYHYTGDSLPVGNIGDAKDRVEIGRTKEQFYPGRPTGDRATTFDCYDTKPGQLGSGHPQGIGDGGLMGGVLWQALQNGVQSGVKGDSAWNSKDRYWGGGWGLIPIGAKSDVVTDGVTKKVWQQTVEVKKDWTLLAFYKNNDTASGNSHDNALFMTGGPNPRADLGLITPGDPAWAQFDSNGNRDWRRIPHFGQQISGKWYGQDQALSIDDSGSYDRDDAALITDTQWVRQVLTPDADWTDETFTRFFIWAWKHIGTNGSTKAGNMEVAVFSAPIPTSGAPTFTKLTGWNTIPGTAFKECKTHPHGQASSIGRSKLTSLSDIFRHGYVDIKETKITKDNHYALTVRAADSNAVFATSGPISGSHRFNRGSFSNLRDTLDASGVWPGLFPWGGAGRRYNRPEISTDSGVTWKAMNETIRMPICLFEAKD